MEYFLIKPGYPENYGRVDYMDSETQGEILQNYTLDNKPIEELNLDLPLRFEVTFANNDSEKTMLPFYTLNTRNALFRSDFLESVLAVGGSGIKTLDMVIIERRNGREYHDFKFIIMKKIDIIDKTKKNYWDGLIVLEKDDARVKDIHIFYINDTSILVDEDVKNSIEQHSVRNIIYYNPEKYAGL